MTGPEALRSPVRVPGPRQTGSATVHVLIPTPVEPFPTSPYADPFKPDPLKFQPALDQAIHNAETRRGQSAGSFPVPFVIAEVTKDPPFPMCTHLDSEVDYIASEAKVAVMYAAFELRAMVRRFVAANPLLPLTQLFSQMDRVQTPKFLHGVPLLESAKNITDVHRKPTYSAVFSTTLNSAGLIDFSSSYLNSITQMIVPSNNGEARNCIHGIGYSYLNGVLKAAGFFDGTGGIWIASDYQFGKDWPPVRAVMSTNDGPATLTGTTHQMARILALIRTTALVDTRSSSEMDGILKQAAQGVDGPWTSRDGRIPVSKFLENKLGLGPKGTGPQQFRSEVSMIQGPVDLGRTYVVAWQNLLQLTPYDLSDMTSIILDAITQFEA